MNKEFKNISGKFAVPHRNFSMESTMKYFSQFGNANIQECKLYFLVYIEGKMRIPKNDVVFLDGVLLYQYVIPNSKYWMFLRQYNEKFRAACTCKTDDPIEMEIVDGKPVYPNNIEDLPRRNNYESFELKVVESSRTNVLITIMKKDYRDYIRSLTSTYSPEMFPIISSSHCDNGNNMVIKLKFEKVQHILSCISHGYSLNFAKFSLIK